MGEIPPASPHTHPCPSLPLPLGADFYKSSAGEEYMMDEISSTFMRMTISNIRQRSPLLWCVGGLLLG